ncbi:serine/threonine-protein kinase [Myxococcus sp. AS-1-15]|uniref:serine/threonine-protein kinase n=1 Tax=Myxococcus sp. AS-1-15 TaxID=2874600 RepID=UPI001CBEDDAE|nr:serine/threonine-protein kinase [Myxococcus sp. AS-1-15]MBZ4402065.1 protein kinase [Myxococcus sp. AS-1-15]
MRCLNCHRRLAPGAACPVHGASVPGGSLAGTLTLTDVPGVRGAAPLGRGGFSQVFTAYRDSDGREVALKVGHGPHHERFAREAAALRRVGAPIVPELLEHGVARGRPFLVMEHLHGQTLAAWMAALPGTGAASLPRVRELLRGLCSALEHMHAAGVAHRDLKPENIFLREGGALSLLDLGLARFHDLEDPDDADALPPGVTPAGQRLGTPLYMAPEQCLDARLASTPADIYSLGIVLFELLTGAPPFVGSPEQIRHGHVSLRPPKVSERAEVPAALDDVLRSCLAKSPLERFARAPDVLAAFDAACRATTALGPVAPGEAVSPQQPLSSGAGPRQVALLGLHTPLALDAVKAAIEPRGGLIARVRPGGYVIAFAESLTAEANVRAGALAARKLLEESEASAVLHLAELHVRVGASTLRLAGAALDSPADWWPQTWVPGETRVTEAAAARLDSSATEAVGRDTASLLDSTSDVGRLRLLDSAASSASSEPPPLFGREDLLESLAKEAFRSLSESVPGFSVVTADVGLGKSRVIEALAARLESSGQAQVIRLRATAPDVRSPEALLETLRAALVDGPSLLPESPRTSGVPLADARHAAARWLAEALRHRARELPRVLLLDDAHLADPTTLDTLEVATLTGASAPLWVCVVARPALLGLRPHLGERSASAARHVLPPLPPEASRALMLHLLRPAEHIPEPVLARLEQLAQGVPLSLVELAVALRTAGALRASPGGGWYIAPDALLDVSVTPLFQRLASRALDGLPDAYGGLARLCAVLGTELEVERVDAALRHLGPAEEGVGMATSLDAGAGLQRLARAGLLRPVGLGRFAFRHPLLRESIEALLPPVTRRALHAAARLATTGDSPVERHRRALHAAACGAHDEAATAFLVLAEESRRAHRSVEAEQLYTRALALLPDRDSEQRARALAGRGRVRHRLQRFHEGLGDLAAARALAEVRGDKALCVDLLLEEATARDWMEDVEGSTLCAREALERIEQLDDPRLSLRCTLARGRLHVRQGEWGNAARILDSVIEGAERAREHETLVVALTMLGSSLTFLERTEEAASRFEEALARCEAAGDALHLAATLINRVLLWLGQGDVARMEEDLRRAMGLGRELGHAQVERWSTFNLAEVLYMQGRLQEALPLARRAHELGVRFFLEHPVPVDALLLARIGVALGDWEEASRQLRWIEFHCPPASLPPTAVMRKLVELQVREAERGGGVHESPAWTALEDEARELASPDEKAELLLQAAHSAFRSRLPDEARTWLTRAESAIASAPLWRTRWEALRDTVGRV